MNIKVPTPEKMNKYPWATTAVSLFAVCVLLLYFILKSPEGCKEENTYLRKENARITAEKDQLITALLIKNGIIYKQEQDKKELDSTLRTKVGEKAKKIVEGN